MYSPPTATPAKQNEQVEIMAHVAQSQAQFPLPTQSEFPQDIKVLPVVTAPTTTITTTTTTLQQ